MQRKLRCSLLCEDREQERLFRPLLERLLHRRIYVIPRKPNGGFTFVLARLREAALYIRRRPQEAAGLLVVVDGDAEFRRRLTEIHKILREVGIVEEEPSRIAICIPTRNVETWCLWLCGESDLDEQTDYKSRYQREFKLNVGPRGLAEAWLTTPPERLEAEKRCLPALAHGRAEIERLRQVARV